MKIRITGELDEINDYIEDIKKDNKWKLMEVSGEYKNKNSEYYRVYVDIKKK